MKALDLVSYIKEHAGVTVVPCDHFTGDRGGYFNLMVNGKISEPDDYAKIERIAGKGLIKRIEANGINRIAVFL